MAEDFEAEYMVGGGLTTVRDCLVWTLVDCILSNLKTGRSDKSLVCARSCGPSSVQVRKLLFYSLSNSARRGP